VSWPLHLLLLGVSLLVPVIGLLTLYQPAAPLPPSSPLQFSGDTAANLAGRVATAERDAGGACCEAGSQGELAAADWVTSSLHQFDPSPRRILFATNLPWQSQPVPMTDVIAYRPGRSRGIIAIVAHRDGRTPADLAGTAILVELAKVLDAVPRDRGIALISTDGGLTGGQGAAAVAARWAPADRIVAAIVIDAAAARGDAPLHIVTRPSTPHGVSPTLYAATRNAVAQWYGSAARIPGAYDQLSGYGVPYAPSEQGALLAHGISALTLTVGHGRAVRGPLPLLDAGQLGRVGTTVANLVAELNSAPTIERDGSPVLLLAGKVMRGWLAEASMAVLLAPFIACVLDLVARLRRRRMPIAPGIVAFAWRSAAWLITLAAMWVLAAAPGRLLSGIAVAPLPGRTGATTLGIVIAAAAGLLFWRFVSRPRLIRIAPGTSEERTAGLAGGLVGLAFAGLLLTAVNPFALIVVLPAAHIWLWLPAAARAGRRALVLVYLAGMIGPLALVWELWSSQGLGSSTPRALVAMTASGYLAPAESVCFALAAAAAAQLGALVAGRYANPHGPTGGGARGAAL
jgi:peptidase M28-like protein